MITDEMMQLVNLAIEATQNAYVPYSQYPVGAALLASDGQIFQGCNVENAAYPATICAERTALVKAVSEGVRDFEMIAVVTQNGGYPCGICRQMMYEFSPHMQVIIADIYGNVSEVVYLSDLLPGGFGPEFLEP